MAELSIQEIMEVIDLFKSFVKAFERGVVALEHIAAKIAPIDEKTEHLWCKNCKYHETCADYGFVDEVCERYEEE